MTDPFPADGVTGAVRVRPWSPNDLAALVCACQDPEIPRWTRVPSPYTEEIGRDFLARTQDRRAAETDLSLAITDLETDALLGATGLHRIGASWPDEKSDLLPDEVGYWLAADARGRGVATEAVRLLCDWAFRALGRSTLWLQVKVGNDASSRVAQRAGFTYVETRRELECGATVGDLLLFRGDAPEADPATLGPH